MLEPIAFSLKPELKIIDQDNFLRNEFKQFPGISLKAGIKTDIWFRFRENKFKRKDYWYYPKIEVKNFFQIRETFRSFIMVPDNELDEHRIARVLYRNEEIESQH